MKKLLISVLLLLAPLALQAQIRDENVVDVQTLVSGCPANPVYDAGSRTVDLSPQKSYELEAICTLNQYHYAATGLNAELRNADIADAATVDAGIAPDKVISVAEMTRKMSELDITGDFIGSHSVFASLPTTSSGGKVSVNGDYAIMSSDEIGIGTAGSPQYPRGIYLYDGTEYVFSVALSASVLELSQAQVEDNAGTDFGMVSGQRLNQSYKENFGTWIEVTAPFTPENGKRYRIIGNAAEINPPAGLTATDNFYFEVENALQIIGGVGIPFNAEINLPPLGDLAFSTTPNFELQPSLRRGIFWNKGRLRWELDGVDRPLLMPISSAGNNGDVLFDGHYYNVTGDVDGGIFKMESRPGGVLRIRLRSGALFPITIQQFDTSAVDQFRLENNTVVDSFVIGTEYVGKEVWIEGDPTLNRWDVYRSWIVNEPDHELLEHISVGVRSGGTNAGSNITLSFDDIDGNTYPASDWAVSGVLTQYAGGTAVLTLDNAAWSGGLGIGRNKQGTLNFKYVGENPNGLSAVNYVGASGANSDGAISVLFDGTSYSKDFANKGEVTATEWTTFQTPNATDQAAPWLAETAYPADSIFSHPERLATDPDEGVMFNWVVNTGESITDTEFALWDATNAATIQAKLTRFGIGTVEPDGLVPDWQANTAYEVGDRVVATMPINADFISSNGAIAGVNYIFEAVNARPNTVAAFNDVEVDGGDWSLIGTYYVNGTDDRVVSGSGTMGLDPLSTLSNTAKNEYIHWTTTDTPQTIRLLPAPAFVTTWKDYTGNNIAQPTAANEDFVLPADSQMWVHRVGNALSFTFESNQGGSTDQYVIDDTGAVDGDSAAFVDDGSGGLKLAKGVDLPTGTAVERIVYQRNRGDVMVFGDLQFRVPSSGVSSLQFRVGSGSTTISNFTTRWSNQQGGASENAFNFAIGTSWVYFRQNGGLNLTLHNSYQDATFTNNGWFYRVEVIVGGSWVNNRFSFTRWRLDGIKGDAGTDGTNGVDGVDGVDAASIDHISLTAGDSSPGTTDTYTLWADAGETVALGTYDVPIPVAPASTPAVLLGSYSGAYTTGSGLTLAGGRTWQDVLDECEWVYVLVGGNNLYSHDISVTFHVDDLTTQNRDMTVMPYLTHGSNAYHIRMITPPASQTFVTINNDNSNAQFQRALIRCIP